MLDVKKLIAVMLTLTIILSAIILLAERSNISSESPQFWRITEEPNTYIERIPTVRDFVPLGITYTLGENNILRYIPGHPWQQSCFIFVAIGWSDDNDTLYYQGRLPFRGMFKPRISINGKYLVNVPVFKGGMYYYENGTEGYPYPTVLVRGQRGYREIVSYNEKDQIWYHAIIPPDENGLRVEIRGEALGVPFWMGPQEGPYIIHGAYSGVKDVDAWGGFWVVGRFDGKVKVPCGKGKVFHGYFLFDRATHIAYYAQYSREPQKRGSVLEFSCLAIFDENFIITLCTSRNPTPTRFPKFQHQGRINIIFNESYVFNDFVLKSIGDKLQPSGFELKGNFECGNVDLKGRVIEYWPPSGWKRVRGAWWDPSGQRTWGRAFIKWNGEIKFNGKTMRVEDAIEIGEFTRFQGRGVFTARGTVRYIPLEGGFYGIIADGGKKYLPLNLPEKYRHDGLRVCFRANLRKDVATISMWGEPIEILEIKKVERAVWKRGESEGLSKVKVAILYERIGDGRWMGRTVEDEISIFKDVNADFIFRAFWRWSPCPEKCMDLPAEIRGKCILHGYSYEHLEETISQIKDEMPNVIICGAIPAQIIQRRIIWNPKTKETIKYPETWNLALDPSKWGINMSKEELQCRFAMTHLWVPRGLNPKDYTPETAKAYFPDITNPQFQELLLSWAERQIDAGVDAIWIDMLFKQAVMLYRLTGSFEHPAVKESYQAACKIIERIREYGRSRGKEIFIGSWPTAAYFPYPPPSLDFVTVSPSGKEVMEMKFNEEKWNEKLKMIRSKFGDIPIFAFIDWAATSNTPLGRFSQSLTKEQQREFLRIADEFFREKDVIFVYPVHGGNMGIDAHILSFGKSRVYDAIAPEFKTYMTIRELAQKRT